MQKLKKFFPMAFTLKLDVKTLIVDIILHLLFAFGVYVIGDLLPSLGTIGIVLSVLCRIGDVYLLASMVLSILHYCNVFK